MGNLSNSEATNLLQGYMECYALAVLKRYMTKVPSVGWRVDGYMNTYSQEVEFPLEE